jgi:hypothetical protein
MGSDDFSGQQRPEKDHAQSRPENIHPGSFKGKSPPRPKSSAMRSQRDARNGHREASSRAQLGEELDWVTAHCDAFDES